MRALHRAHVPLQRVAQRELQRCGHALRLRAAGPGMRPCLQHGTCDMMCPQYSSVLLIGLTRPICRTRLSEELHIWDEEQVMTTYAAMFCFFSAQQRYGLVN